MPCLKILFHLGVSKKLWRIFARILCLTLCLYPTYLYLDVWHLRHVNSPSYSFWNGIQSFIHACILTYTNPKAGINFWHSYQFFRKQLPSDYVILWISRINDTDLLLNFISTIGLRCFNNYLHFNVYTTEIQMSAYFIHTFFKFYIITITIFHMK